MMFTDRPPHHGGTWLLVPDTSTISYRVDGEDCAELLLDGPLEISLSLTEQGMRRCAEVLTQALDEMHAASDQCD